MNFSGYFSFKKNDINYLFVNLNTIYSRSQVRHFNISKKRPNSFYSLPRMLSYPISTHSDKTSPFVICAILDVSKISQIRT